MLLQCYINLLPLIVVLLEITLTHLAYDPLLHYLSKFPALRPFAFADDLAITSLTSLYQQAQVRG